MRGCGSVGRASPCQGEGRGFESRHPLRGAGSAEPQHSHGGLAERLGTGLQSRLHRFESGTHLGRLAQRERASLTRKRSLVRSQYRPPEPIVEVSPEPSAPGSCRSPGRRPRAGWHVSPSGRDVVVEVRTIARNHAGLRGWGGDGRGRSRVWIVMFLERSGTGRPGVLYHLGRSWPLRQETDGYDATLQAPAARGPRR